MMIAKKLLKRSKNISSILQYWYHLSRDDHFCCTYQFLTLPWDVCWGSMMIREEKKRMNQSKVTAMLRAKRISLISPRT